MTFAFPPSFCVIGAAAAAPKSELLSREGRGGAREGEEGYHYRGFTRPRNGSTFRGGLAHDRGRRRVVERANERVLPRSFDVR